MASVLAPWPSRSRSNDSYACPRHGTARTSRLDSAPTPCFTTSRAFRYDAKYRSRFCFEVSGSFYQGTFRLTAFTPEPGPRQYRFASVDPIVVSLR